MFKASTRHSVSLKLNNTRGVHWSVSQYRTVSDRSVEHQGLMGHLSFLASGSSVGGVDGGGDGVAVSCFICRSTLARRCFWTRLPPANPRAPPPRAAATPAALKPASRPSGPPNTPPSSAPATGNTANL